MTLEERGRAMLAMIENIEKKQEESRKEIRKLKQQAYLMSIGIDPERIVVRAYCRQDDSVKDRSMYTHFNLVTMTDGTRHTLPQALEKL